MPDEPLSIVDEMATSVHEIFESLIRAGFTEWQSCQIVAAVISNGSK